MSREKLVTVFPTYGYRTGDSWTIPVRVWVHKRRRIDSLPDDAIRALLGGGDGTPAISAEEIVRCRECVADFIADDDSGERVTIHDEEGRELYSFPAETNWNGLVKGEFQIPDRPAGWLTIKARVDQWWPLSDYEGEGRVRLLEPEGTSVVSDIDDTIKVSQIPAGTAVVLRNTFLRPFEHVEEMVARYHGYGEDVSFHYVSGSPWQLFNLLHKFLIVEKGFPPGTFHMKSLQKNPLDLLNFIGDLRNFVAGPSYTMKQKIEQISGLMDNLPGREFVLIGDSGECDPETFARVRGKYGARVREILIRMVTDEDPGSPRFEGMTPIPAPAVKRHGPPPECRDLE